LSSDIWKLLGLLALVAVVSFVLGYFVVSGFLT
jgi:uncharacterized membrane protein